MYFLKGLAHLWSLYVTHWLDFNLAQRAHRRIADNIIPAATGAAGRCGVKDVEACLLVVWRRQGRPAVWLWPLVEPCRRHPRIGGETAIGERVEFPEPRSRTTAWVLSLSTRPEAVVNIVRQWTIAIITFRVLRFYAHTQRTRNCQDQQQNQNVEQEHNYMWQSIRTMDDVVWRKYPQTSENWRK